MSQHPETNPYFIKPLQHQRKGPRASPPSQLSQPSTHQDPIPAIQPHHDGQHPQPPSDLILEEQQPRHHGGQPPKPRAQRTGLPQKDRKSQQESSSPRKQQPYMLPWLPPPGHQDERQYQEDEQHHKPQNQEQDRQGHGQGRPALRAPMPRKTHPLTWFGAIFCAIFWVVVFLGGLIVLIIYLVYRPSNPWFNVSSVTLNAAYIDAGALLNADISVLANFTNPNKKATVDFNSMIIDLYYGTTLIATNYIEPFSADKAQSRFVNLHMVTSQVRLSTGETQQLQEQTSKNAVIFNLKGAFRVRSNLGSFLRYSYRLYSHCTFMVTGPPTGVLRGTKCRTKR